MRNIDWNSILPGQIVTFNYKSNDVKQAIKRTVLCINPLLKYRKKNGRTTKFFVAIQLDTVLSEPITPVKINRLIQTLGGPELQDGAIAVDIPTTKQGVITQRQQGILMEKVKKLKLDEHIRTFNLRKCKRYRVFLETKYKELPSSTIRMLESRMKLNYED